MVDKSPGSDRERFFRIGCVVNLVVTVLLLGGGMVAITQVARSVGKSTASADEKAIRAVLDDQVKAWNKGELDGFMAGYWNDEALSFVSNGVERLGWKTTRERYEKRYWTEKAERGELSFSELKVESFSPQAAVVRGRFTLKLTTGQSTGLFTLVLRKYPDGWKITHDHTSAECPPEKK
jgi:uncharacterized protein (TIGR02246 family)